MPKFATHRPAALLALAAWLLPACALAQSPAPEAPRPILEQLNGEIQNLYRSSQASIVRVQLPTPKWIREVAERDNPLDKWKDLDPAVQSKLDDQRQNAQQGRAVDLNVLARSSTQPAVEQAGGWTATRDPASGEMVLRSPGGDGPGTAIILGAGGEKSAGGEVQIGGQLQMHLQPVSNFAPNNIGLLLDSDGHVLIPLYLEKGDIADGVKVMAGDGQMTTATFVGSDKQTLLTVLKLKQLLGKPAKLGPGRPADGSLVMLLSPGNGSGRLVLWTSGLQDWGVAVTTDGAVAGFARSSQFLSASTCAPVVQQLIATGTVRRATLGIGVRQVFADDPVRQQTASLGGRPALQVQEVKKDSAAEKAGLASGDLILRVASEPVGDTSTFAAALTARTGKTELVILRGEREITVTVDLKPQ